MRWKLWLPLAGFVALAAVAGYGLRGPGQAVVKSHLVGKPLPEFALDPMVPGKPGLIRADFNSGKPRLLNVFASWCVPCIVEAPHLMTLKKLGVEIDAVAIGDTTPAVEAFLARNGDPYARIGNDHQRMVQIGIGSSGVPETFVIDGSGKIAMQHIGDIREEHIPAILAALEAAK